MLGAAPSHADDRHFSARHDHVFQQRHVELVSDPRNLSRDHDIGRAGRGIATRVIVNQEESGSGLRQPPLNKVIDWKRGGVPIADCNRFDRYESNLVIDEEGDQPLPVFVTKTSNIFK